METLFDELNRVCVWIWILDRVNLDEQPNNARVPISDPSKVLRVTFQRDMSF